MRIQRRLGTTLPGLTTRAPARDAAPPGMHGRTQRQKKLSDPARRLIEKQKLRFHYGVSDRQLRNYYNQVQRRGGVTGHALLALLERRLDNVVFRLGFAPTVPAARQLVSHRHVLVNGRRVNIASYLVSPGETISIRPESREVPLIRDEVVRGRFQHPSFLERDPQDPFVARVVGSPTREDVVLDVDESLVLEHYGGR